MTLLTWSRSCLRSISPAGDVSVKCRDMHIAFVWKYAAHAGRLLEVHNDHGGSFRRVLPVEVKDFTTSRANSSSI